MGLSTISSEVRPPNSMAFTVASKALSLPAAASSKSSGRMATATSRVPAGTAMAVPCSATPCDCTVIRS